eukprot:GFUD01016784.1.p1 GENE.GFUD01016784.1~~GFUD01016784.1.p1  ORF type:complete len:188 (-),score=24.49 GFUD01016784.1:1-564(-)
MALSKLFSLARRYPLVPSMLTYSVLYPSANVVQQVYFRDTYKQTGIDWKEVSRFLIYGGLFHAPLVFNWLRLAARLFPKDTMKHLAAKVFMDQACFAPMALSAFYIGLSTLEGKDKEGIYKEWRDKFPNTWAIGFCIWPFLQTVNFKFVPQRLRPIYVGVFSFFWTTGLAAMKHTDNSPDIKIDCDL